MRLTNSVSSILYICSNTHACFHIQTGSSGLSPWWVVCYLTRQSCFSNILSCRLFVSYFVQYSIIVCLRAFASVLSFGPNRIALFTLASSHVSYGVALILLSEIIVLICLGSRPYFCPAQRLLPWKTGHSCLDVERGSHAGNILSYHILMHYMCTLLVSFSYSYRSELSPTDVSQTIIKSFQIFPLLRYPALI